MNWHVERGKVMYWEIEPRDPIIVGDGRPFSTGGRSESLNFPFPTTIAGIVRTRKALTCGEEFSDELLKIGIQGPLLYKKDGLLVAPPADAVVFDDNDKYRCVRLAPVKMPDNSYTNMPDGLMPVGMVEHQKGKPSKKAPKYWHWRVMERWLESDTDCLDGVELGESGPVEDWRTGVSIDKGTKAAAEGKLFQRKGLDFSDGYTMLIRTDAKLASGYAPMGGERRIVLWKETEAKFPSLSVKLRERVLKDRSCRLVLLTPAYFEDGLLPNGLGEVAEVVAVVNGRYQTVSGWDLKVKRAKPSRRLVPAGSVYFLKLSGEPEEVEKWLEGVWFENISDGEQNRRDGLGLAAIGVWNGEEVEL